MYRFILLIVVSMLANCLSVQIFFELQNDPNYPQLISVSGAQYTFVANKYIEISGDVIIHEEINDGTNVSDIHRFDHYGVIIVIIEYKFILSFIDQN